MNNPDHTTYWTNSLANNPTGSYLSFAATDPAMLHATLSLVSQHEAFMRREPPSRPFYFHRGEAIRILTARIGNGVEAISDATIGAVAVLSITDVSRSVLCFLAFHKCLPVSQSTACTNEGFSSRRMKYQFHRESNGPTATA